MPSEPLQPFGGSASEQNPDREKLVAALDPSGIEGRNLGASHAGLVLHPRQAEAIADAILASDWLAEHDERVRREAAAEQREKDAQIAEQHGAPEPSRRFSPEHWDEWRERTSVTTAAAIREQGSEHE